MKNFLLLLLLIPFVSVGQSLETTPAEELRVIEKLYYDRGVYIASEEERAKLHNLIFEMRADSTLKVHIVGYCDKWGGDVVNDRFSYVRAQYIANWMCSCRVPREQITFAGRGIDRNSKDDLSARRVEVLRIVIVEALALAEVEAGALTETEAETETETEAEALTETETETETEVEVEVEALAETKTETEVETKPEIEPTPAQPTATATATATSQPTENNDCAIDLSLRTNMLYWLGGLMNLGVEWQPNNSQLGVVLNGGYSPFGDTDWSHNMGGWFVSPELRYYTPRNERWFVGVQFLAGGYNIKLSDTGRQGSVIGGGVMGGYKMPLSRCFDIDFTLGVGYAHFNYDTYFRCEPNNINPYISKDDKKGTILPLQLGVNLIWKTDKR